MFSGAEGVTFAGEMRNEALERPFAQGGREDGEEIVPSPSGTAASTKGSAYSYSPPPFLTDSLSSPTIRYYACDHLGTPRLVMDEQGGVLERRDFEPFGAELPPYTPAIASSRFTVHERDEATTYDYMHFRSYASSTGRFLKPDNIWGNVSNPQSWNLYAYVKGNPVTMTDPTGHIADESLGNKTEQPRVEGPLPLDDAHVEAIKDFFAPAEGPARVVLGVALVASALVGDAPGGTVGALLLTSAVMGGTATAVSGTAEILGEATNTDVSAAAEALEASGNLGGLLSTAASGGDLEKGKAGATVTDVASLAASPKDATKNAATLVDAGRTLAEATKLVRGWIQDVRRTVAGGEKPGTAPK
ncbi:MAG: RHS repeat-associated core domain-containing protein [Acidobacteriota bacterium]